MVFAASFVQHLVTKGVSRVGEPVEVDVDRLCQLFQALGHMEGKGMDALRQAREAEQTIRQGNVALGLVQLQNCIADLDRLLQVADEALQTDEAEGGDGE